MNVALFTFRTLVSTPFPEIKRVDRNVSSLKKKRNWKSLIIFLLLNGQEILKEREKEEEQRVFTSAYKKRRAYMLIRRIRYLPFPYEHSFTCYGNYMCEAIRINETLSFAISDAY